MGISGIKQINPYGRTYLKAVPQAKSLCFLLDAIRTKRLCIGCIVSMIGRKNVRTFRVFLKDFRTFVDEKKGSLLIGVQFSIEERTEMIEEEAGDILPRLRQAAKDLAVETLTKVLQAGKLQIFKNGISSEFEGASVQFEVNNFIPGEKDDFETGGHFDIIFQSPLTKPPSADRAAVILFKDPRKEAWKPLKFHFVGDPSAQVF